MKLLSEREMAKLTNEKIDEYITGIINEAARLRYARDTPTSKFWVRISDYRRGVAPTLPTKGVKTKAPTPSESDEEIEAPTLPTKGVKTKGKVAPPNHRKTKGKISPRKEGEVGEVKKVVLEVGRNSYV
jgi:hypothetical protein